MSCNAEALTRYIVSLSGRDVRVPIPVADIISVSGLGMGDQGVVTLTQQDRIIEIPDGIRNLPDLTIEFRFKPYDLISVAIKDRLFEWYNKRNTQTYDLSIFITNRTFCPIHAYKYVGCSINNITENDKSMGKSEFSIITAVFTPYDIIGMFNTIDALKIYNVPGYNAAFDSSIRPSTGSSFGALLI